TEGTSTDVRGGEGSVLRDARPSLGANLRLAASVAQEPLGVGKTPNLLATTIECGGDPGQAPSMPLCRRKFAMVYKFDPTYSTATIFDLDDSTRMMEKGWMEFVP